MPTTTPTTATPTTSCARVAPTNSRRGAAGVHSCADRWGKEVEALTASGWHHEIHDRAGMRVVDLDLPIPGTPGLTAPLRAVYPELFPWFPPAVFDTTRALGLTRHQDPNTGQLCLLETSDWHLDTTLVALLKRQIPALISASRGFARPAIPGIAQPPRSEQAGGEPQPGDGAAREVLGAEPVTMFNPHRSVLALAVPDVAIPAGIEGGAVVIRFDGHAEDGSVNLYAGIVDHILAPGLDIAPYPDRLLSMYPVCLNGQWLRVNDLDPTQHPDQMWAQIEARLLPVETRGAPEEAELDAQLVGLLIPSEVGYREQGEEWLFLLRQPTDDAASRTLLLDVDYLDPGSTTSRTPAAARLAGKHAVIVGVGALGGQIALDLARTGIGHLGLVDGDVTRAATSSRQHVPVNSLGYPKVAVVGAQIRMCQPFVILDSYFRTLGQGLLARTGSVDASRPSLAEALTAADLVIDATADPATSRYLSALRSSLGKDLLTVSATAGGWGGVIHLQQPESTCWACIELHRADHTLPVPPENPTAIISPARCSSPSYEAATAELGLIAHTTTRVAVERLQGNRGLGGTLHVARLHDPDGHPIPGQWTTLTPPIHPECPFHPPQNPDEDTTEPDDCNSDVSARAPIAESSTPATVTHRPEERQPDGPSSPRAPLPRTQQSKRINRQTVLPQGTGPADRQDGDPKTHSGHEGGDTTRPGVFGRRPAQNSEGTRAAS